ncbi:MAG: phosphatidylserine decarboxylase, partial [Flammeovirgaceae bacterium]
MFTAPFARWSVGTPLSFDRAKIEKRDDSITFANLNFQIMIIHREGRVLLFVLLVVLFALNWAISYFLPQAIAIQNISIGISIVFYLLILQFFRSPVFTINQNEKHVIAPADGKVVVIEEADEPEYLKSRRKQ